MIHGVVLTLIFHVFSWKPNSSGTSERCGKVRRLSTQVSKTFFQPGKARMPYTSKQPSHLGSQDRCEKYLRPRSWACLCAPGILRHVPPSVPASWQSSGGDRHPSSQTVLRYLISPKLKQMKKHPKSIHFLQLGKKLYRWYTVTKNRHVEICPPIGGCVRTSV